MLAIFIALLMIYAWWAPATWLGRLLNDAAAALRRRLAATRPLTFVLSAAVLAGLAALVAYGGADGLHVAAMAAPEAFAWFAAIDIGVAVELVVTAGLVVARGGLQAVASALRRIGRGYRPRAARRTTRRPRRVQEKAANDDDPAAAPRRLPQAA
jgi:hypothetical protein